MYTVRDIFYLKFGHYKPVKVLFEDIVKRGLLPKAQGEHRVLTDFTGHAYRFIMEKDYTSLAEYEKSLSDGMNKDEWQKWYDQFVIHVEASKREILKKIV